VKLAEEIARLTQARLVILLIGERPGGDALAARSLSAYLAYHLLDPEEQAAAARASGHPGVRFEYTVISNIYSGGLPPVEAGSVIAEKACQILTAGAAGNRLEALARTDTARA
jgi:ethanolamine ammonia-lyase large subunit